MLGFAVRAFALHWDLPTFLTYLQLIPADMLYLQNIGFTVTSSIGVLWYLSAMTFAVWVLYPLLRRRYELVASVSPAVILLILGLIQQNCGSLDAPCTFLYGWLNTGLLRAFAGILGGVLAYYVTQKVRGINITKGMAAALTVFEVAVYIWVFYHTWSRNDFRPLLDAFVIVALGGGVHGHGKRQVAAVSEIRQWVCALLGQGVYADLPEPFLYGVLSVQRV